MVGGGEGTVVVVSGPGVVVVTGLVVSGMAVDVVAVLVHPGVPGVVAVEDEGAVGVVDEGKGVVVG